MKTSIILLAAALGVLNLFAEGTAFTYQGRLSANGAAANGTYDLLFTVYASASGANDGFANQTNAATVLSNGLFTATLDFGSGIFTGDERWLQIAVRPSGSSTYTNLGPRQLITPTPFAIHARMSDNAATVASVPPTALPSSVLRLDTNAAVNVAGDLYVTQAMPFLVESFEGAAFPPNGAWSTFPGGGSAPWFRTTDSASQGSAAASSGAVPNFGDTFLQFVCTMPVAGVIKFDWKVESDPNHGILRVEVDFITQTNISGLVDWTTVTLPLSAGAHNIRWVYAKDGSAFPFAQDRGWVDNVRLLTATGAVYAASFTGDGSRLSGLNASNLVSGTVDDTRLSANVAVLNRNGQGFTGSNSFRNVTINPPATLSFGAGTRQMLNLWGVEYGIGVQSSTVYFRTHDAAGAANGFAWYKGGTHNDAAQNSGGGTTMMTLNGNGLTVNGTFVSASDRNAKQEFAAANTRTILEKVARLPIQTWAYTNNPGTRHIGPVAQDFYAAFGVGSDDKHIATVDADGVALAAIQGLNQKVESENAKLHEENAQLKARLEKLERLMKD